MAIASINCSAAQRAVRELLSISCTPTTDAAIHGLAIKILQDNPFEQTKKETVELEFKHNATTISTCFSNDGKLLYFTDGKTEKSLVKTEFVIGKGVASCVIATKTILKFLPFLVMEGALSFLTTRSFSWINVAGFGLISALPNTIANILSFELHKQQEILESRNFDAKAELDKIMETDRQEKEIKISHRSA